MMEKRAKEFLKVANWLIRKQCRDLPKEGCYRTIVNRLYYGTLHLVAKELTKAGKFKPEKETPRIHSIVIGRLKHLCPKAGEWLEMLHHLRKKADYDLQLPFRKEDLKTSQVLAKLIMGEISRCLTDYRWKTKKL